MKRSRVPTKDKVVACPKLSWESDGAEAAKEDADEKKGVQVQKKSLIQLTLARQFNWGKLIDKRESEG